jgi:hypothetical protein
VLVVVFLRRAMLLAWGGRKADDDDGGGGAAVGVSRIGGVVSTRASSHPWLRKFLLCSQLYLIIINSTYHPFKYARSYFS